MGQCCYEVMGGLLNTVQTCLPTSSSRLKDQILLLESKKQLQKEEKLNLIAINKKIIEIKLLKIVAVCGR